MKSYKRRNSKSFRYKKNRIYNNLKKNKYIFYFVGALLLAMLIVAMFFCGIDSGQLQDFDSTMVIEGKEKSTVESSNFFSDSEVAVANMTPPEIYQVVKVVDGDTLWVNIDGVNTKVRLIGVNTPETVSTSTPTQCYGPEASEYVKSMLSGKYIGLESDSSQGDIDMYGRALRYVFIDGQNLNFLLIMNGYGFEYTYNVAYKYQSDFMRAENEARNTLRGLWFDCDGQLRAL